METAAKLNEPHWSWYPFLLYCLSHKIIYWTSDGYREWVNMKNGNGKLIRPHLSRRITEETGLIGAIIGSWSHSKLIVAEGITTSAHKSRHYGVIRRWRFSVKAMDKAVKQVGKLKL